MLKCFVCSSCRKPIREAVGECNHFYLETPDGIESGPYHEECATQQIAEDNS